MSHGGSSSSGRISRRAYLTSTGLTGLAGLAGCISGNSSGGGGDGSYKVGVITAQSGSYAFLGEGEIQGAKLAARDLEDEFDIDIEIVTADTESTPSVGLERMKRLVNKNEVDFTLGGVSSSVAITMGNWASSNGVAYMAAGSHSDATTGADCAKYMFRPTASNSMLANKLGAGMADFADSWYIMYADYTWGQTGKEAIKGALNRNGGEVVGEVATPFPSSDYSQYLNRANSSDADGLAVVIAGTDQRTVTQQFLNKGMHEDMKMAGPLFEESVFWGLGKEAASIAGLWATPWANCNPTTDFGQSLQDRVVENFDTSPFSRHYLGYTSMDQLVRAAERGGSSGAEDIRTALEGHSIEHKIKPGDSYWREGDHQLVQPVSTVKPRSVSEMQDDPYKRWFKHVSTTPGDEVARPVSETGCSFE